MTSTPHRVVIAGGGVAGLEALLALHALAGDRVELTLVAPTPDFVYRPLAVAEPFAVGHRRRTPLAKAARTAAATFVQAPLTGVDVAQRTVRLADGETLSYDALVLATGAAAEPAFGNGHVFTWDDICDAEAIGGLLRDLEEGYSQRLAIVIPPGPGWPLPAYELALLISADARGMGMNPEITLVTPEQAPLAIFGPRAVEVVADGGRGRPCAAAPARPRARGHPGRPRRLRQRRRPRAPRRHRRRLGRRRQDRLPVKFGGLAAEQADAVAADIAANAGAVVERAPFRPVLRGRLLTSSGPR